MKNSNISQEFIKEREDKMFTTLNSKLKRMLSVVLALSMVLSPIMALAEEVGEAVAMALERPVAVVFAASDFQPRRIAEGNDTNGAIKYVDDRLISYGITAMEDIAKKVKNVYGTGAITGALFCGDYSNESKYRYDHNYSNNANITIDGINAVRSVYGKIFELSDEEIVMIQGNHDFYLSPLSTTNAHDTEDYGVYAINEKDFMYKQANLANGIDTIKKTAEELDRYLQAKVAQHYSKPIFILNHIPLHHNPRAEDNLYSQYLFDVINRAGGQGLKIFYLFGHNHSKGYDAHIGEAAIYLKPGEDMYIPDPDTFNDPVSGGAYSLKRTLNFSYMNAGYVGYVTTDSTGYADNTLTGTVFAIYEDRVEVKRYSAGGEHALKAAGKSLTTFKNHYLHTYSQTTQSDVVLLNDKFNVSLNTDNLFPRIPVTSKQVTGITITEGSNGSGDYNTGSGNQKVTVTTSDKELDLPIAENFKVGSTGTIGIDYVAEQYKIKSVVSSKPGVATVSEPVNGEVTVTGFAPGETTLTIVAEHVGGVYGDVSLTYDLVVFPASTKDLYYTRYKLLNAIDMPGVNLSMPDTPVISATSNFAQRIPNDDPNKKYTTWAFESGESYIFVDTHKSKLRIDGNKKGDEAYDEEHEWWAYALVNTPTGKSTSSSRNVAAYAGGSTISNVSYTNNNKTKTSNVYYNTYVDISDEYMEWVYCKNGQTLRNSATGIFLTSNVKNTDTLAGLSLIKNWPRDADGNGTLDNDYNYWAIGEYGLFTNDGDGESSGDTGANYRRYMRFDFANKTFKTETDNSVAAQQYSNISIYKKVTYNDTKTGETAWLDTTTISAFKGDIDGVTGATMYISDGINVTPVPVTLNMLYSETANITTSTVSNNIGTPIATNFNLKYDTVNIASNITVTARENPTWDTMGNKTIKIGAEASVERTVTMPGSTKVEYTYESLNVACATVSSDGTVTGTGVGGANIRITATATYSDGSTLSTTDEVYVTVNPSDTCYNVVRNFGKNEVYTLIRAGELDCDTYENTADSAEPFMIVSSNDAGEAFAMQNYAGFMNNLNAKGVNIESHNGVKFIQNFDNSILWQMVQKGGYCSESNLFTGGTEPANGGWRLPNKTYYQVDSMNSDELEFLIALQNLNNNEYDGSLTMDCDTNLFCSEGGNSFIAGTISDTYPTRNGVATMYKEPAAAWNYNQENVGLAGINYYPSGNSSYFSKKGGHFTYVMTYDEKLGQFKAVFHDGVWPSGIQAQFDSTGEYPGRVYLYAKRNIETSGVIIWISDKNEGTVGYNATSGTATGAMINVTTHSPEGVTTVSYPLTYGMLSKEGGLSTAADAKHESVTVKYTYNGKEYEVCTKFTLNVKNMSEDYPDYPDQGSVNTNKTLDTSKYPYKATGVSHIDLTVSGIPLTNGIDIVVMIDASTSMQDAVGGNTKTRLQMLYEALEKFMISLRQPDENGKISDVDVAIASFNGQTYLNKDHLISPLVPICGCGTNHGTKYAYYDALDMSTVNLPFADVTDSSYDAFIKSLRYDIEKSYFGKDDDKTGKKCNVKTIKPSSGTNYDKAMDLTYDLLTAKQAQNSARGENREQYVIFMTDGETWQYNYFGGRNYNENKFFEDNPNHKPDYVYHTQEHKSKWMYVLDGGLTEDHAPFAEGADLAKTQWYYDSGKRDTTAIVEEAYQDLFKKYYNPEGKHWMAEAIKAPKNKLCMIIDPDSTKPDHIEQVYGLGATMYTIAFTIGEEPTRGIVREVTEGVVRRMATSEEHFTAIETDTSAAENLLKAFMKIKDETKTAGSAMYVDQMGDDFDLQMKTNYTVDGKTYKLDPSPSITITSYPLYKYWEVGTVVNGVKVSQDMVGKRKSNVGTLIEEISFPAGSNGAVAQSSLLTDSNVLGNDGIIRGKNVWYNTNSEPYTVKAADVALAPSLEGKILEPETFYWMIGDVPEDEYVLGYDVYLDGSMEGTALAGQHDTNNFATLTYINHLGHECTKDVPSPKLPWDKAYVGVGFYFVNDKGLPLVNRKTGKTGSFEASQKLPDIVYYEFELNETQMVDQKIIASQQLPKGYTLYDQGAEYEVFAASSDIFDQRWTITKGDVPVASTYVTQIGSTATSSNKLQENSKEYTYTNTIVYFAIKGTVNAVPDTVVIDYSLRVDINVMANDILFADQAKLVGVSPTNTLPTFPDGGRDIAAADLATSVLSDKGYINAETGTFYASDTTRNDTYGALTFNPDKGTVRYTPRKRHTSDNDTTLRLQFNSYDTFQYAVYYTGDVGEIGYYCANVYVIPATTIYYEENFLTYKVFELEQDPSTYALTRKPDPISTGISAYDKNRTDTNTTWYYSTSSKTYTQGEDRPGKLSQNDVNNIYGYDGSYLSSTSYSEAQAAVLYVKADETFKDRTGKSVGRYEGEVSFSFYGTGFDVVAATSSNTGAVVVQIYSIKDGVETFKQANVVDTYYGYTYDEKTGEWKVTTSSDGKNALYQIPVLKISDLPYGQYKVYITVSYSPFFDHHMSKGNYAFILDGIRIYDPAKNDPTTSVIKDAYIKDNEYLPVYKEVRDLLISADSFNSLGDSSVSGSVFIDDYLKVDANGNLIHRDYTISDYINYGPNNEVYLIKNQAIAFNLNAKNASAVHLALKAVGTSKDSEDVSVGVSALIYNAKMVNGQVKRENVKRIDNIKSSTELYYDISKLNGGIIVIENLTTAVEGSTKPAILSITNLKFTYESTAKRDADKNSGITTISQQSAKVAVAAMKKMAMPWLDSEMENANVFVPEQFDASVSKTEVRQGSTVTVTVNTSADVDHITINGVEVTKYTKSWFTAERQWKYTVRIDEAGDTPITVVAYNADGEASAELTNTVSATERVNLKSTANGSMLDRMYSGWVEKLSAKAN